MKKVLDVANKIAIYLIIFLFALMVFTIFLQVVLRFVFNTGTSWAEEAARYSFEWMVLLGGAVAVRRGRHMRVEYFIDKFPPLMKAVTQVVLDLIVATFLIVLCYNAYLLIGITHRQMSTGTNIPMSIPYASIFVGSVLMLVFMIESVVIRHMKHKKNEDLIDTEAL